MSALCDQIELFADGELSPEEAEAFRNHLPGCPRCPMRLANLLVLDRLGTRYVAKQPAQDAAHEPLSPRSTGRKPPRRWPLVGLGAVLCVLVATFALLFARPKEPSVLAWNPSGRESDGPRMSDPRADQYLPPASQLMGPSLPPGPPSSGGDGPPTEDVELLQKQKDWRGLAAAYQAWNQPAKALDALANLRDSSPDVQSDRAAILLKLGKPEEALRLLDMLLSVHPKHRQARWNRGLVFEALGLPLLAARDFQEVARAKVEGWAGAASKRAEALVSSSQALEARWLETVDAGNALLATARLPEDTPLSSSPLLRLYFYDAVRTRTSAEEVRLLLPLAKQLDAEAGGQALQRYVEDVAQRDFTRRAPLAREYARLRPLLRGQPQQASTFLATLLRSGEGDLILGVLPYASGGRAHLDVFEAHARASQDPWFEILAAQQRANAFIAEGDFWSAKARLEEARGLCDNSAVIYRCVDLELDLAYLHARLLVPEKVQEHAMRGWALSRTHGLRGKEPQFLGVLSQAARIRNDVPMARAYLYESLERVRGDVPQERFIHQALAHLELRTLDFDRAREEIDRVLSTGLPLTLEGAGALSDIARQRRRSGDEAAMQQAVAGAEEVGKGTHALALHYLGRFYVEQDRTRGQALLRDAIREAEEVAGRDENAVHARTYSYTSLILDAAKARDFDAALKLFGEELGLKEVPGRCVFALTEDSERSLFLVRGADGALLGYYDGARTEPLPRELGEPLPEEGRAALAPCEKVEVLARPPLQGRGGVLSHTFAWSYRTRPEAPRPVVGKAIPLVVKDVEYDPARLSELKLKKLRWESVFGPDETPRRLEGALATPRQVLREMEHATEVVLVTHGLVSPESEAAYLLLAREGHKPGSDELWVRQLRQVKLKGAPLVVLAACHGGHSAPLLHAPVSLPNAFLEAGARAVMAPTQPIPDQEASAFFREVRRRIREGATPAAALRDERVAWHARQPEAKWPDSILLFE
jgi:tetratricopeptide (TPR) repeat protein